MTKAFNAEEFNKNPKAVYDEAQASGRVKIHHMRYAGKVFEIICRNQGENLPSAQKPELSKA